MRWLTSMALMMILAGASPAAADWITKLPGVDGASSLVMFSGAGDSHTLIAYCQDDEPHFSIVRNSPQSEAPPDVLTTFELQTDSGPLRSAQAYPYLSGMGQYALDWNGDVPTIIGDIIAAGSSITVTLRPADGDPLTMVSTAKGSTAAGRKFLENCGGLPVAPATTAAADWTFEMSADAEKGGQKATMSGALDEDRFLFAVCDSEKTVLLAVIGFDLPYEVGDVGLSLHVEIDGKDRSSTGEFFVASGDAHGVTYTGLEYLEGLFGDLAAARSAVSMRVVDYSDNSDVTWHARSLNGLTDAASRFVAFCWGEAPVTTVAAPLTTDWSFSQSVDDVNAGYRGVMRASTGNGPAFPLTCGLDGRIWTLGVFGSVVQRGAVTLAVDIEGLTWAFPATDASDAILGQGLAASGETDIFELMTVLSLPRESIGVDIVQGDQHTVYRFKAGDEAADVALEMFRKCSGLG